MEQSLATAWVLMVILRALWILIIPTITIIAASMLWRHAPRWIPVAFVLSAVFSVLSTIPSFLILLHQLTAQEYGKVAVPVALAAGAARIFFAVAVLALAIRMKRMAEQGGAPYSSPAAGSESGDLCRSPDK